MCHHNQFLMPPHPHTKSIVIIAYCNLCFICPGCCTWGPLGPFVGPFWEPWGAFWGPGLEGGEPDFIRGVANAPAGIPHTFRIQFSGGILISAYIPHTQVSILAFFPAVIHARDNNFLRCIVLHMSQSSNDVKKNNNVKQRKYKNM